MKIRITYNKLGMIKYISHLDMMRLFHRTFRRMDIPILFSQGYNPHMLMSLANPLALGVESEVEFMDFETDYQGELSILMENLNKGLPEGITAYKIKRVEDLSINEIVKWSVYEFDFLNDSNLQKKEIEASINELLSSKEIIIEKRKKKKGKKNLVERDVRNFIKSIIIKEIGTISLTLTATLRSSSSGGLNPIEFSKIIQRFLNISRDIDTVNIKRIDQLGEDGTSLR